MADDAIGRLNEVLGLLARNRRIRLFLVVVPVVAPAAEHRGRADGRSELHRRERPARALRERCLGGATARLARADEGQHVGKLRGRIDYVLPNDEAQALATLVEESADLHWVFP